MEELELNENFLYVDRDRLIKVIEMPKLWHSNKNLILLPSVRLFGTREKLDVYGVDLQDYEDVIDYDHFMDSEIFDTLLGNYAVWMTDTLKENINAPGNTFITMSLAIKLNPYQYEKESIPIIKSTEPVYESILESDVPIKYVKQSIKRPKKAIDIDAKIKNLEPGKIINISRMNEYGIGTSTINYKNQKNVFITRDERVMTNNYKAFEMFFTLLKNKKYIKRYTKDLRLAQKYFKEDKTLKEESKKLESSEEEIKSKKSKSKKSKKLESSEEESEEIKKPKIKKSKKLESSEEEIKSKK